MARPSVRHCEDCRGLYAYISHMGKYRLCKCSIAQKFINGQEIRNSPRWCPLGRKLPP